MKITPIPPPILKSTSLHETRPHPKHPKATDNAKPASTKALSSEYISESESDPNSTSSSDDDDDGEDHHSETGDSTAQQTPSPAAALLSSTSKEKSSVPQLHQNLYLYLCSHAARRNKPGADTATSQPNLLDPIPPTLLPPGFKSATISRSSTSLFEPASLNDRQVWHITAPASVPITSITSVALDSFNKGEPTLTHDNTAYGFVAQPLDQCRSSLLVPGAENEGDGYRVFSRQFDLTLQLQQLVKLPSLTAVPGANSKPISKEKPVRPQPEGLRMRFTPLGLKDGPRAPVPESVLTKAPSVFQVPRGSGVEEDADRAGKKEHGTKKRKRVESIAVEVLTNGDAMEGVETNSISHHQSAANDLRDETRPDQKVKKEKGDKEQKKKGKKEKKGKGDENSSQKADENSDTIANGVKKLPISQAEPDTIAPPNKREKKKTRDRAAKVETESTSANPIATAASPSLAEDNTVELGESKKKKKKKHGHQDGEAKGQERK